MSELYQKTSRGLKWSIFNLIIPRIISPVVTVALARILTPESFGLITTAMMVISFSQMIWEAGLSQALIQSNESVEKVANVVFWSNIILGIFIYIIIFFLAPYLAVYFKSPLSLPIIRVLGLQIILMSFTTVHEALFSKELNFRPLFWIRIITAALSGCVSVSLALMGFNVWALVSGTLFGSLITLVMLWFKSSWRPSFKVDWSIAPNLFRYGSWIMLLSLMGWFITWFDSILVGRFFGVFDLGIYRTSVTISFTVFSMVMMPIVTVMFPSFSKLSNDPEKITHYYNEVNKLVMSLVLPAGVGLYLVGREFAIAVLGVEWEALGAVLGLLGLNEGIGHICGINPLVYQAIGKPDIQPKISIFLIPIFALVYWFAAPYGITTLLWAKLILTIVVTPVNVLIMVRTLKLPAFYLFEQGKYILIALLFLCVAVSSVKWTLYHFEVYDPSTVLLTLIFTGIISYIGSLWYYDKEFLLKLQQIIKTAVEKAS